MCDATHTRRPFSTVVVAVDVGNRTKFSRPLHHRARDVVVVVAVAVLKTLATICFYVRYLCCTLKGSR